MFFFKLSTEENKLCCLQSNKTIIRSFKRRSDILGKDIFSKQLGDRKKVEQRFLAYTWS